ncbi:MAG: hypothetical protein PHD21_07480, partial [Flavobacteriales bacterium]|nr:hypothetical protein [Flavobacteriales bacterium]
MEIEYSVDGKKFKDYGVYVSSSSGILAGLKPKTRLQVEWEDENGYYIDQDAKVSFLARSIALTCFLVADGSSDMQEKVNAFTSLFYSSGTKHLLLSVNDKTLAFDVKLADKVD